MAKKKKLNILFIRSCSISVYFWVFLFYMLFLWLPRYFSSTNEEFFFFFWMTYLLCTSSYSSGEKRLVKIGVKGV
ncbi:hypothetical protein BY458DRAFT_502273 [Sporodiniella umbellata]|nr:hypothetical protein BY458DRAFT_502273 [Sporodiniella umbellata]